MSQEQYEDAKDAVLSAQEKRVSSETEHFSPCDCSFCDEEREARNVLSSYKEHILEQKNWVYLMLECLGRI